MAHAILELHNGAISVSNLAEDGTVTHTVRIGTFTGTEADPFILATQFAHDYNWLVTGSWYSDKGYDWVDVEPKPVTITFVGGWIDNEYAVRLARDVGYEVQSVIQQKPNDETGKNIITFAVDTPNGWDWGAEISYFDPENL